MAEFYDAKHRSAIRQRLHGVTLAEEPIAIDRAARLVMASFGLIKLTAKARSYIVDQVLPVTLEVRLVEDVLWLTTSQPQSWRGVRVPDGTPASKRNIEDIPLPELIKVPIAPEQCHPFARSRRLSRFLEPDPFSASQGFALAPAQRSRTISVRFSRLRAATAGWEFESVEEESPLKNLPSTEVLTTTLPGTKPTTVLSRGEAEWVLTPEDTAPDYQNRRSKTELALLGC